MKYRELLEFFENERGSGCESKEELLESILGDLGVSEFDDDLNEFADNFFDAIIEKVCNVIKSFQKEPDTNFDRITFTPETLAKWRVTYHYDGQSAPYYRDHDGCEYAQEPDAIQSVLGWLNSPKEEKSEVE